MSIRIRVILILLLVGIVPTLIAVFGATAQVQNLAIRSNQATLEELAKATIRDKALATAQQVQAYLLLHPEIDLSDAAALQADQSLAALAVQPVGQTGYTAVFDDQAITHFHANPEIVGVDLSTLADPLPEFWAVLSASLDGSHSEGYYDWQEADGSVRRKFMAIVPVGDTLLRVAATTYIDEFAQPARAMTAELERLTSLARLYFGLFAVVVGLIVLGVAFYVGTWFTAPLRDMAAAADRVVQGEWDAIRPSRRRDELGSLNRALYAMTIQLQGLVQGLEQEVAERTADLEHRTRYLEATAVVSRDATSVLDPEELLSRVVTLISERFGFYHTGIFLLDATGEWAVLQAASSEGGQRMLVRGHRLKVGEEGMVGYVTGRGEHRIALDVGADAAFFGNPDLPDTRSEMALPLRARGEIIGALDVQSTEPQAFSDEDVATLQTLADQVAMALSNARLFQQAQESLEAERRAYGELSREAWSELLRAQPRLGFRRDKGGVSPVGDLWQPEITTALRTGKTTLGGDGATSLAMPIKVRGQVIGVIDAHKPDDVGEWTPEQTALLETLTDQLGAALESARLYQETQRRATRERLTGEVTARMRETLDVETVLKTAVQEVRRALGLPEVVVRLGASPPSSRTTGGGRDGNEMARPDGEERTV
jgi:GAF domain-containing protein/HAMP domain-containing protein